MPAVGCAYRAGAPPPGQGGRLNCEVSKVSRGQQLGEIVTIKGEVAFRSLAANLVNLANLFQRLLKVKKEYNEVG